MTERSASTTAGVIGISTVEVLLSGSGSGVGELTIAVLVRNPVAVGLTIPLMIRVMTSPGSTVPKSRRPVHGSKLIPPSIEYSGFKIAVGILSIRVTLCEADGPALVTVMV